MWPFQVNYWEEITLIIWPILLHKIAKQKKISHIWSTPQFPKHDVISGNHPEVRFFSAPSFSTSQRPSFISHLISSVLGAYASLGNRLGESKVFIWNLWVHQANEESEETEALILYRALSCFTMFIWGESKMKRVSGTWVGYYCFCCLQTLFRISAYQYLALHVASKRVCHIHHGELFNYGKENDRKTEWTPDMMQWWIELNSKCRLVSQTKKRLEKSCWQGEKNPM